MSSRDTALPVAAAPLAGDAAVSVPVVVGSFDVVPPPAGLETGSLARTAASGRASRARTKQAIRTIDRPDARRGGLFWPAGSGKRPCRRFTNIVSSAKTKQVRRQSGQSPV